MRTEHKTTGDEWDLRARVWDEKRQRWSSIYTYLTRAGARARIKKQGHRKDRRVAKRMAIREEIDS